MQNYVTSREKIHCAMIVRVDNFGWRVSRDTQKLSDHFDIASLSEQIFSLKKL